MAKIRDSFDLAAAITAIDGEIQGLLLSAEELKELTDWPDAVIEDYLAIIRNMAISITKLADLDSALPELEERVTVLEGQVAALETQKADIAYVDARDQVLQDQLQDKVSSVPITGADQIVNMMALTQAEYDAITSPDPNTLYIITDA